jgi:hypothetical protein
MVVARPQDVSEHVQWATRDTPGHVIYVIDVSWSMQRPLAGRRRIEVGVECVNAHLDRLRRLCTTDGRMEDRYQVAVIAYSDRVFDLLSGFQPISATPPSLPSMDLRSSSEAAAAFSYARELLAGVAASPPPLVLHVTDGSATGGDLVGAVGALVPNGRVDVAHLMCGNVPNWSEAVHASDWHGVTRAAAAPLPNLRALSDSASLLPDEYRQQLRNAGFLFVPDAVMVFPARFPTLVQQIAPLASNQASPLGRPA